MIFKNLSYRWPEAREKIFNFSSWSSLSSAVVNVLGWKYVKIYKCVCVCACVHVCACACMCVKLESLTLTNIYFSHTRNKIF